MGYVKIRAIDVMDGNTMKVVWVKKDEATIAFEEDEARKNTLDKKVQNMERRKRQLEALKAENDIIEQEKKLDAEFAKYKNK